MKRKRLDELNSKILEQHKEKEIVLGYGREKSKVMLIGEAPGANEVKLKKPFVGQAGKYLDEFLDILKITRENIYITNTVKFRPTRESSKTGKEINRAPVKKEIEEFKEYLLNEIEIISPKVIVTLGNIPLKAITGDDNSRIGDLHGQLIQVKIKEKQYNVFPLYHPAAVLYKRELKKVYYDDLEKLKKLLENV